MSGPGPPPPPQCAALQTCPRLHTVPQAPQLAAFVCTSTQLLPHGSSPAGHTHWPALQIFPPEQAVPQVPQFRASV